METRSNGSHGSGFRPHLVIVPGCKREDLRCESANSWAYEQITWFQTCVVKPTDAKENFTLWRSTPLVSHRTPISYEGRRGRLQGDGRTLAISSGAIRFACHRDFLPVGLVNRLGIQWPVKLGDGASLNLSVIGKIRRSAFCEVEVAIVRQEFRTRRGENGKGIDRDQCEGSHGRLGTQRNIQSGGCATVRLVRSIAEGN